jgi:hypothetical protein
MTSDPRDGDAAPGDVSEPEPTEEEEPAAFANRAARRAKGKGANPQPTSGKGHHLGGRGSVQGPRQWGNRRSG